jgi:hypothetical protein
MSVLTVPLGTLYSYYKLYHSTDNKKECYVSSTLTINSCFSIHRCRYMDIKYQHIKLYKYIRENGGLEEWNISILEKKRYKTPYERYIRESELIKQHNATLHTYEKGSRAVNYDDKRKQICGRCNKTLNLCQTSKVYLNQHFNTKKCKKAIPIVILKTDDVNIHY